MPAWNIYDLTAWGGPLNSRPNKQQREAAAGALDSIAGVNDLPWWGKAGRGALHVKNWELGVVLRPDPERPLQMDWPYRPETLRPYAAGEKIALRSALREIRSTYWKQIAKERRAVEAQEAAATAAATAAAEVIAPRADPSG